MYDVFICHASEDKDAVARPLADAVIKKGLRVWFDEYTLKIGDSLRRTIDVGLRESRYGIVILSNDFFAKEWPQKELDGLAEKEVDGKKVILPIWHDLTRADVEKYSPMLAGRLAAKTKDGIGHAVDMIMDEIGEKTPDVPGKITENIMRITADKDSFVIGGSVTFSGISTNCGDKVHIVISGPGDFSRGKEVAVKEVSSTNTWDFTWSPGRSLLPGVYTVSVFNPERNISDDVIVKVEKGGITIVSSGSASYYIGEKVRLVGTCTAGEKVYLLLKGPDAVQKERKLDDLSIFSIDSHSDTFVQVDVRSDHTWSYTWDTAIVATQLTRGFYRIYAIEGPFTTDNLIRKSYGFATVIIRLPFVSATAARSAFVKGERILITGTAEGVRNQELLIWIFGESFSHVEKVFANTDASYSYEIPPIITKNLIPGQFFAIVQHPMMNNEFDVYLDSKNENVLTNFPQKDTILFPLVGEGRYQGFDAIKLLIEALNNPKIDDTYTRLSFEIEPPIIHFDPVGDKRVGKKFVVNATTNLSVDENIFIEIYPSIASSDSSSNIAPRVIFSGTTRVIKGEGGYNKISVNIDTSGLTPDEFTIKASAMDIDISAATFFNVFK